MVYTDELLAGRLSFSIDFFDKATKKPKYIYCIKLHLKTFYVKQYCSCSEITHLIYTTSKATKHLIYTFGRLANHLESSVAPARMHFILNCTVYVFGGLECVGHSFSSVAYL